jgi:hypothetical protein
MGRVRVASARAFGSPPDGIAEMLNAPHALDVASLSAALKIDLAVALGIIRDDDASIFRKINSIRNTFAHSSRTEVRRDRRARLLQRVVATQLGHERPLSNPGSLVG